MACKPPPPPHSPFDPNSLVTDQIVVTEEAAPHGVGLATKATAAAAAPAPALVEFDMDDVDDDRDPGADLADFYDDEAEFYQPPPPRAAPVVPAAAAAAVSSTPMTARAGTTPSASVSRAPLLPVQPTPTPQASSQAQAPAPAPASLVKPSPFTKPGVGANPFRAPAGAAFKAPVR